MSNCDSLRVLVIISNLVIYQRNINGNLYGKYREMDIYKMLYIKLVKFTEIPANGARKSQLNFGDLSRWKFQNIVWIVVHGNARTL